MARLDYANARVGARRPRLLGGAALRGLLARASPEERLDALRALPLGDALPDDLGADPLARVDAALREAWRREAAALLDDVEGPVARALLAAYLGLDDASAAKAVLRAVARRVPADRALAAAPVSAGLTDALLRAAVSAPTVEAAIAALADGGWPLAAPLGRCLPLAPEAGLAPLELALDRAAFARALGACRGGGEDGGILARHVADRIDARNASTLLALAGAAPAASAFVAGGRRLREPDFRRLAGAEAAPVRAALASRFGCAVEALASPWSADRALERAIVAPLGREARRRPMSIAVPLAYLAERRAEVRRAGVVLRGAALGLPADEILDLAEA